MTYEERMKYICSKCPLNKRFEACGYLMRNMMEDCISLQNIMYGWELGQSDTIEEIEKLSKSLGDSEGFHYNFYVEVMKLVEQIKKGE